MAGEAELITIRLMFSDELAFNLQMKKITPFGKLMRTFCEFTNIAMETLTFLFDGETIRETDTPLSLELEENDAIGVYLYRIRQ